MATTVLYDVATVPPALSVLEQAKQVLAIERDAIEDLRQSLDDHFSKALQCLLACKGRVIVTGMGKSGHIGKKMAATFSSTGTPAFFLHPAEGSHGDSGVLMRNDVVLALSNSGETPEMLALLPVIKRMGLPIVAMTGKPQSTLAQHSTVHLNVAVQQEACPLGLAPTTSTTVALALGDALAVTLLTQKGFTPDDFALFHPAGSLGKRLLLTVRSVMRTGNNLPSVGLDTPFLEALLVISAHKLGMTLVLDEPQQTLLGILTDGDIRRALMQQADISQLSVQQVMTPQPKTIAVGALAATALQQMESAKITSLVVIDPTCGATPAPVGVVVMHDLLAAGLG
jgi:arabinose-5-phosphate isomerase